MWWKVLLVVLVVVLVGWAVLMTFLSGTSRRPDNLGVHNNKLAACPNTPNCVSSQAEDDSHRMAPIPFHDDAEQALARLKTVLAAQPRTTIVSADGDYLHAECVSLIFRFVDDVEFLVDPDAKVIHFRSASRAGRSDLGVNRKRMEEIRKGFESLHVARP